MPEADSVLSIAGFSDPVSSLTHLAAAAVFAVLGAVLLHRGRGDPWRMMALCVFAFSCVLLLSLSGVYHLLSPGTPGREVLRRLDHAAIFVLIAGSFTPVHVILFRGAWRWGMLAGIWGAALTGLILKTVFFATMPEWLGLAMYLGLGWMGVISALALARRYGWRFIQPVLWGALAYTAGAIVEFLRWPVPLPGIVGPHEIFHLAVLAGISCHWAFILGVAPGEPIGGLP
ncbi:MAG TPA: hemolysin III family protein [Gammaproteobacteria bacterium]|nr:hemolysin III family protein [Gammaproteobacteria bacterium]